MKNCGSCAFYSDTRLNGIICQKSGKPVGFLQEKPCFEPLSEVAAPPRSAGSSEKVETMPGSRMGRPARYPNKYDHEKGRVLKHCACCGEYKPLDEFPKNKTHKDGHASECKVCHNKMTLESQKKRRAAMKARKEAAAPEAPAAAAAPVKAPEPKPTREKPVKTLASYTDTELAEELKSRGWFGVLTKALQLGQ
jgi:hypothetical protein